MQAVSHQLPNQVLGSQSPSKSTMASGPPKKDNTITQRTPSMIQHHWKNSTQRHIPMKTNTFI